MFTPPAAPENESVLLARAQALAGYTFGELAAFAQLPIPENLKRDKGWVGMLLEYYLGASAGSKPEQDFSHIGVELKTIPIDRFGTVSYTHLTLPTTPYECRSRWSPYH